MRDYLPAPWLTEYSRLKKALAGGAMHQGGNIYHSYRSKPNMNSSSLDHLATVKHRCSSVIRVYTYLPRGRYRPATSTATADEDAERSRRTESGGPERPARSFHTSGAPSTKTEGWHKCGKCPVHSQPNQAEHRRVAITGLPILTVDPPARDASINTCRRPGAAITLISSMTI
jgi:hypothetical protein